MNIQSERKNIMNKKNQEWVQGVIDKQLNLIKTHSVNLENQPDDSEPVHQFRVRLRHLRSLLSFFKPELSKSWVKDVNKFLKHYAAHFSATREMDVIQEYVQEFEQVEPQNNQLASRIMDKTKTTRKEAVENFDSLSFNEALEEKMQNIQFKKTIKKKKLQNRLDVFAKEIIKNKAAIDLQNYQTMHDFRKEVKLLRYTTSSTSQFLNHDILDLASVKRLSKELGILTDVTFIRNILPSFEEIDNPEVLEFFKFLHTKEQSAYKNCISILQPKESEQ